MPAENRKTQGQLADLRPLATSNFNRTLSFIVSVPTLLFLAGFLLGQISQEVQRRLGLGWGELAVGAGVADGTAPSVGFYLQRGVLLSSLRLTQRDLVAVI